MIEFTTYGHPVAQGSPRIGRQFGNRNKATIRLDSDALASWRAQLQYDAAIAFRDVRKIEHVVKHGKAKRGEVRLIVYDEPVVVYATYHFKPTAGMRWGNVKATRPDLDKLNRAVGDSLEGAGIVLDDSRIVGWPACPAKIFNSPERVVVRVMTYAEWMNAGEHPQAPQ